MLTHSTKDKKHYDIYLHGFWVRTVVKVAGGFVEAEGEGAPVPMTMRDLKEQIYRNLPDKLKTAGHKSPITVADAFRMNGMSHTGMYVYLREIKKMWPEWPKDKYGPYLVRKHQEAIASWGGLSGQMAQDWLDQNPDVGTYDKAEEERRIVALEP